MVTLRRSHHISLSLALLLRCLSISLIASCCSGFPFDSNRTSKAHVLRWLNPKTRTNAETEKDLLHFLFLGLLLSGFASNPLIRSREWSVICCSSCLSLLICIFAGSLVNITGKFTVGDPIVFAEGNTTRFRATFEELPTCWKPSLEIREKELNVSQDGAIWMVSTCTTYTHLHTHHTKENHKNLAFLGLKFPAKYTLHHPLFFSLITHQQHMHILETNTAL